MSAQGESDYAYLGDDFPATKLNYPSGHMGTYWEYQGGAFAVAAVAFFDWHMVSSPFNTFHLKDVLTRSTER